MKTCTVCTKTKELKEFYIKANGKPRSETAEKVINHDYQ